MKGSTGATSAGRAGRSAAPATPAAALRLRAAEVRLRPGTLAAGVGLGAVLLLVLALLGGVGGPPARIERPAPGGPAPETALQPRLHQALLNDYDLPAAVGPGPAPADGAAAAPATDSAPLDPPAPEPGGPVDGAAVAEVCQALFTDPDRLADLWRNPARAGSGPRAPARGTNGEPAGGEPADGGLLEATPLEATPLGDTPLESASRRTSQGGGKVLHQVLGVFEDGRAAEAYQRLRGAAGECDRFPAMLRDGRPVTVLLRNLAWDRRESAAAADEGYALGVTIVRRHPGDLPTGEPEGLLAGWLALDRLGPVVSVLHHLEPVRPGDPTGPATGQTGTPTQEPPGVAGAGTSGGADADQAPAQPPADGTPAAGTQAAENRAPETQAPGNRAPETQAPETQATETPATGTHASETPAGDPQAAETHESALAKLRPLLELLRDRDAG